LLTSLSDGFLLQEYIPGDGYGFFGLFNQGALRAIFMHKRLREYPITGGPSTVAESVYEPRLKELGLRILRLLNWHGAAMVEFRKDFRDNEYKLMEINPKFWGSLDLAIASGVDFPYLTCKMAVDGDVKPVFRYKVGVKFMWPFPDDFQRSLVYPLSIRDLIKDLIESRTHTNISWADLNPNLIQILKSFVMIERFVTSKKRDILRVEFK
jgi:predicted ATP-grasp superfamily ATP-dependent carboligase